MMACMPRPVARAGLFRLNVNVPLELSDLVIQLLAKDAAQRPASAQAVIAELSAIDTRAIEEESAEPRAQDQLPSEPRT
jgi:hypothetical protein